MPPTQKFEERVVRVEKPSAHFTLLRNEKGDFLGTSEGKIAIFDHVAEVELQRAQPGDVEAHPHLSGARLEAGFSLLGQGRDKWPIPYHES